MFFIERNITIVSDDLLNYEQNEKFSNVSIFAVLNYFNLYEATAIYRKAWSALIDGGVLIVKHQMGIKETVEVNKISEELGTYYFSQYRALRDEIEIIRLAGFSDIKVDDIYPAEYNRFEDTHFYAIIARKFS